MEIKCLSAEFHIDSISECRYRTVYSESERQVLHYHDFFEIFLVIKGAVKHTVNGITKTLSEGSLVFIRPNDLHIFKNLDGQNFILSNLTFTKDTVETLFSYLAEGFPSKELMSLSMPPMKVLNGYERSHLNRKLEELNAVEWQDKAQLKLTMRTLLVDIFVRYFSSVSSSHDEEIPFWLENLYNQMKKPHNFIAGTQKMIEISGKSREHIARNMQKYYGITPTNYINELRLNYLANTLETTNSSVVDLVYECGFNNVSWCYTLFKEKYGTSPKNFRKNLIK